MSDPDPTIIPDIDGDCAGPMLPDAIDLLSAERAVEHARKERRGFTVALHHLETVRARLGLRAHVE